MWRDARIVKTNLLEQRLTLTLQDLQTEIQAGDPEACRFKKNTN